MTLRAKSLMPFGLVLFLGSWMPALAQDFTFALDSQEAFYDPIDGAASFALLATIDEDVPAGLEPSSVFAVSYNLAHDGDILEATGVDFAPWVDALNFGAGPTYIDLDLAANGGDGLSLLIAFSYIEAMQPTCEDPIGVAAISYETVAASLIADTVGVSTDVTWTEIPVGIDLGNFLAFDDSFDPITPEFVSGTVALTPIEPPIIRGDANGDGFVNALIDALYLLHWGFKSGAPPPCVDAGDVDDNGELHAILDSLYLLNWQFNAGPAPPSPGPLTCGPDEVGDSLECLTPPPCA
ncbi:MAG: hypothetical protein L0Z55_06740 [Planctomycetes bacterium]|nr:hypothetical protein [Planctomycetota bacterium]